MRGRTPTRPAAIYYLTSTTVQLAAGLVVLPLALDVLGPADFGVMVLLLSGVRLVATLGPIGAPQQLVSLFAQSASWSTIRQVVRRSVGTSAVIGGLLVIVVLRYAGEAPSSVAVSLAGVTGFAAAVAGVAQAGTRLAGHARATAVGIALTGPTALATGTAYAWFSDGRLESFMLGYAAIALASTVYSFRRLTDAADSTWERKSHTRFAPTLAILPLIIHPVMMALLNVADRFVIARALGPVLVGEYHLAYQLLTVLTAGTVALANGWSASLVEAQQSSRESPDQRGNAVRAPHAQRAVLLASWTAALWGGDVLVETGVLNEALEQPEVIPVLASAALPFHLYLVRSYVALSHAKYWLVATASAAAVVTNVILALSLAPMASTLGVAVATLVAYLVLWLLLEAIGASVTSAPRLIADLTAIAIVLTTGLAAVIESGVVVRATCTAAIVVWSCRHFCRSDALSRLSQVSRK